VYITGIPKPSSNTAAATTAGMSIGQWERWDKLIRTNNSNTNAVANSIELVNSAAFLSTLQALLQLAAKPDVSEHTQDAVR
jgi:hypothetical protein